MSAANGQPISCSGEALIQIHMPGLRRTFWWTVVIADVINPILGADFLKHYDLLVDCKNERLIDGTTNRTLKCQSIKADLEQIQVNRINNIPEVAQALLDKYQAIISPNSANKTQSSASSSKISHGIETGECKPIYSKPRRLGKDKYEAAKREISALLEAGIVRHSKSAWSSPIHMVPKGTGWRLCGDYRNLNVNTKPDRYPMPNMNDLASKLANKKVFTKIDLFQAYHQIKIREEDIDKTAITTPFGLFEYVYMPFGLRNASASFQRYMNSIFQDLDFVFIYIDDILIFSNSEEEHKIHLEAVLKKLSDHNLKIKIEKCQFFQESLDYLGYNLSSKGMVPTKAKLEEINSFPKP